MIDLGIPGLYILFISIFNQRHFSMEVAPVYKLNVFISLFLLVSLNFLFAQEWEQEKMN
jgi:hypothetical protein